MTDRVARHVVVSGRVQGVAFRWHAVETARELGVTGWIRNLPDGSVEGHVEGPAERVERMLDWLRHGPPIARVTGVAVSETAARHEPGFEVLR